MPLPDYYARLGLHPDAEPFLVIAAYRALAQRYHPDRWEGNTAEATARMAEINQAYEVLKDAERRREYDAALSSEQPSTQDFAESAEADDAFDAALTAVEKRWAVACEVFPDLAVLRARLRRISVPLAFGFVTTLLQNKSFAQRHEIAQSAERAFLSRYFGKNAEVCSYALELVLAGEKEAARRLNELVEILGDEIDPKLLVAKVEAEFRLRESQVQRRGLTQLARQVAQMGLYDDAVRLCRVLGYTVHEVGGGVFANPAIHVVDANGYKRELKNSSVFIHWVRTEVCPSTGAA
jgi:hypothetical protein